MKKKYLDSLYRHSSLMNIDNTKKYSSDKLMVNEDHLYGFTLNPASQFYDAPNDEYFVQTYCYHLKKLLEYKSVFPYIELYPEFSPAKKITGKKSSILPRLHYHGAVTIDPFLYYTKYVHKLNQDNFHGINEEYDELYCKKNGHLMRKFCERYSLPYQITWDSIDGSLKRINAWYRRAVQTSDHLVREQLEDSDMDEVLL